MKQIMHKVQSVMHAWM